MIVLRSPKGWTGPKVVDGKPVEGTFRAHQVPIADVKHSRSTCSCSRRGCAATGRRSCSTPTGTLRAGARGARADRRRAAWAPTRTPTAACCCATCDLPDFRDYAVAVPQPGAVDAEATRVLGRFLRDVIAAQRRTTSASSAPTRRPRTGWTRCSKSTDRCSMAAIEPGDDHVAPDGRVMEVLSEHLCQGWLEGYLLTGRHGFFSCYEAFIHIVDSMFNQHAKWLKVCRADPVAPADRLAQLSADLARLAAGSQRLQPSGSRLHRSRRQQEGRGRARLSAARRQHAALGDRPLPAQPQLRQRDRRRQAARAAVARHGRRGQHCAAGLGIWEWASNDGGGEPDVVMACCGDVPTLETLAAVELLRGHFPDLQDPRRQRRRPDEAAAARREHPHGLRDADFDCAVHRPTSRSSSPFTAIRG